MFRRTSGAFANSTVSLCLTGYSRQTGRASACEGKRGGFVGPPPLVEPQAAALDAPDSRARARNRRLCTVPILHSQISEASR